MTVKEKALNQYKDILADYCKRHEGCKYCAFSDCKEDEYGDSCIFIVEPAYYDSIFENHNCFSCEYGEDEGEKIHCMRDDYSLPKTEADCKCDLWVEKSTVAQKCKNISECTKDEVNCVECSSVAKNATVQKRIELVEE